MWKILALVVCKYCVLKHVNSVVATDHYYVVTIYT